MMIGNISAILAILAVTFVIALAVSSGIRVASCRNVLDHLCEAGIVSHNFIHCRIDAGALDNGLGKPAPCFRLAHLSAGETGDTRF